MASAISIKTLPNCQTMTINAASSAWDIRSPTLARAAAARLPHKTAVEVRTRAPRRIAKTMDIDGIALIIAIAGTHMKSG
ncbi:hypothetical protein D3C84_1016010 [compost metagenome]